MRQIVSLGVGGVLIFIAIVASFSLFENLDAGEFMVIQSPLTRHEHPHPHSEW